jgi:hypothetical protein
MSATGIRKANGELTKRSDLDWYKTPAYAVDAILPHLREPLAWVDPGCGDGAIAERVIRKWSRSMGTGVELDQERLSVARLLPIPVYDGDFLRRGAQWEGPVDLVIGNPPFKMALEFAERGLELVGSKGEVCLLLRAGFLEAKYGSPRDLFLEKYRPDVYVLAKRPRFTAEGGDSATYIWAVWGPSRGEKFVRLRAPGDKHPAAIVHVSR